MSPKNVNTGPKGHYSAYLWDLGNALLLSSVLNPQKPDPAAAIAPMFMGPLEPSAIGWRRLAYLAGISTLMVLEFR